MSLSLVPLDVPLRLSFSMRWLSLFLSISFCGFGQLKPLIVQDSNQQAYDLTDFLYVFEDTTQRLRIDEVSRLDGNRFIPVAELKQKPGPNSSVWIKIEVMNRNRVVSDWILSIGNHRSPDFLTSYVLSLSGDYIQGYGGMLRPYAELSFKDRTISKIPLHLKKDTTSSVFLQITTVSKRDLYLNAYLQTPASASDQSVRWSFYQASFHGALAIMSLFSLFIYLIDRDKAYLFYGLFLVNMSILFLGLTGMASDFFGLDEPSDFIFYGHITQCLSSIFYFAFVRYFADLKKYSPEFVKWVNLAILFYVVLIPIQHVLLLITHDYNTVNRMAGLKSIVDLIFIVCLSYEIIRSRNSISYYIVAGSAVLILTAFTGLFLVLFYKIDQGPLLHQAGAILEVAIFSVGLGHRMKLNEQEKRLAQQQLIDQLRQNQELQLKINKELENKVRERTEEITRQSEKILMQNDVLIRSNKEKETLLAEIHHRVKNNLQIVSSLLSIQSEQVGDAKAKRAVLEGKSRVLAMGLIHEHIYKTENFAFIDMTVYLTKLTTSLFDSFGVKEASVGLELNASNLSVDVDTAIPLGLIINELITNSLKHAFSGIKNPRIHVKLHVGEPGQLCLMVKDNGTGSISGNKASFGLRLVKELTLQMQGTIDFVHDKGFCVLLVFKKFKLAA